MDTVCVIPARFNSTRFPGKLLALAGGKTVLQRTFENALLCQDLRAVFVATDDERIAKHIEHLGGSVIWTSPECKNGTERTLEAVRKHAALSHCECVLIVQGDHPCTSPQTIASVVRALKSDPLAVMATAATPLTNRNDFFSPHIVKCLFDQHGSALYFSRSPIPYSKNGMPKKAYQHIGIYALRREFLLSSTDGPMTYLQQEEDLEQLKILEMGHRIKIALIDDAAIGIDTPEDLDKLKQFLLLQLDHN